VTDIFDENFCGNIFDKNFLRDIFSVLFVDGDSFV